MFPTVRWPGLLRIHVFLVVLGTVMAINSSIDHNQRHNEASFEVATLESRLAEKAKSVLSRVTEQPSSVDISVEFDYTETTTTTYASGTVQSQTSRRPRIARILCCVTIEKQDPNLDTDYLYRCLSYSMGLDLSRGDLLKIVTL